MVLIALIALDLPGKALRATGAATGEAGFKVAGYQIIGLKNMDRGKVDAVVTDELRRAAAEAPIGTDEPAQALVDLDRIREQLLQFGWVKDARVSRRLPDSLMIDVVERTPAAVWQHRGRLSLIDGEGVVLDAVPVDRMPDLPLLIGPGANGQAVSLRRMIDTVPTLKPQLASASWIGGRRWDLSFATGETVSLPEGEVTAARALQRFAKMDRSVGLLGRDMIRFDLRVPGKMIVRVPPGATPPPAGTPEATG
jgi:cell division protein FtsQ